MKTSNFLFLNVFLILLSGCAGIGALKSDEEVLFALRAKVGVRTELEGFSANMRWVQYRDRYVVSLWGPLGQGKTEISGAEGRVRITDASGQLLEGGDAETLMKDRLGWSVPLEVLQFWVQGLPADKVTIDESQSDSHNRLTRLNQFNWMINFSWKGEATPQGFPYKVIAERDATRITLVIKESTRQSS